MVVVSVIIPTYNSAQYLGAAIESVLSQTYKDFEIIVINDGSTDHTAEIASLYKDRIKYFEQEKRGPAAARNTGLKHALGRYIAFLDADDLFLPNKLERQSRYLDIHPEVGIVYSDGLRFKILPTGEEVSIQLSESKDLILENCHYRGYPYQLLIRNLFPLIVALTRTDYILSVGGFDEDLSAAEDWDLWFRLSLIYQIQYVGGIVAKYRVTQGSNSTDVMRNYKEMEKVMHKIAASGPFLSASHKIINQFYFRRGVIALRCGYAKRASEYFRRSISFHPSGLLALIALILTILFGDKAFTFFAAKRVLFGIRGIKQI